MPAMHFILFCQVQQLLKMTNNKFYHFICCTICRPNLKLRHFLSEDRMLEQSIEANNCDPERLIVTVSLAKE